MTCPVADLLARYSNGDVAQLMLIIDDPTRNPHVAALLLQRIEGGEHITGTEVLKHRHRTCACATYTD